MMDNLRAEQDNRHLRNINGSSDIMKSMLNHFNNPEMSDIILKLGDTKFYTHKFVLGLLSEVFRTMCSHRWGQECSQKVVEMMECEECVPVFGDFLKYLYCGDIEIDVNSALPLLMLADKYDIQPLREKLESFMKSTVKDGSITGALRWFAYSQVSNHSSLQATCVEVIVMKMDEVVMSKDFLTLEFEFLVALLGRDDLVVVWEKTVFDAVCRWIENQPEVAVEEVRTLLSLVRFPMMLPEQLFQIEASAFCNVYKQIFSPILMSTHRFRSIAAVVFDRTFSEEIYQPRNYSHRFWCHFLTVEMNGEAFYHNSVGACCVNHPVLAPPEQYWQIQVMGEKRTSKNTSGCRPSYLPNLGCLCTPPYTSSKKTVSLVLTVTPLRSIKQRVIVDIALFQVKKDKLTRFLCQSSIDFAPEEYFSAMHFGGSSTRKCSTSGVSSAWSQQSVPSSSALKFNPTPMNFAVMFQGSQAESKRYEVVLRYEFTPQDFDHPAEVPCFKFNGLPRMTNSIRVAVVFKPRFVISDIDDGADNEHDLLKDDPHPMEFLSGLTDFIDESDSDESD